MKILYIPSGSMIEINDSDVDVMDYLECWIKYSEGVRGYHINIMELFFDNNNRYFLDCPCVLADFEIIEVN